MCFFVEKNRIIQILKCVFLLYMEGIIQNDNVYMVVGWLFGGLGLWHINLCGLFNAKSIFIEIIISISNNSL